MNPQEGLLLRLTLGIQSLSEQSKQTQMLRGNTKNLNHWYTSSHLHLQAHLLLQHCCADMNPPCWSDMCCCRCCSMTWWLSHRSCSLLWRPCRSTSALAPGLTTVTPSSSCLLPCIKSCLKVRKVHFVTVQSVTDKF